MARKVKEEYAIFKQKEKEGQRFLYGNKDFFLDDSIKFELLGAILVSCALGFIIPFLIMFSWKSGYVTKFDEIGVKALTVSISLVAVCMAGHLWVKAFKIKKAIKLLKENGTQTTAVFKRFFVYFPNIPKKYKNASVKYAFEFELKHNNKTYRTAHTFLAGQKLWDITLKWPNENELIFDNENGYYYVDAGNKEVFALFDNDKVLFLKIDEENTFIYETPDK